MAWAFRCYSLNTSHLKCLRPECLGFWNIYTNTHIHDRNMSAIDPGPNRDHISYFISTLSYVLQNISRFFFTHESLFHSVDIFSTMTSFLSPKVLALDCVGFYVFILGVTVCIVLEELRPHVANNSPRLYSEVWQG